jgi:predicted O-methyltransferase YrrM
MKQRSMLHQETLMLLDHFARGARHGVLEIGAYVGGGTAVMAKALEEARSTVPFVSIEAGGKHDHPHLPSADILTDLRKTLAGAGVLHRVQIVEGWSNTPETVKAVATALDGRGIDMLVIDADGAIARDFMLYSPMLTRDAVLVLDDYRTEESNVKEDATRQWVQDALARGIVREIGVFRWGTWFGKIT